MGMFTTRHVVRDDYQEPYNNTVERIGVTIVDRTTDQEDNLQDSQYSKNDSHLDDAPERFKTLVESIKKEIFGFSTDDNGYQTEATSRNGFNTIMSELKQYASRQYASRALEKNSNGFFTRSKYQQNKIWEDSPVRNLIEKYGEEEATSILFSVIHGLICLAEYNAPEYKDDDTVIIIREHIVDKFWDIYSSIAVYNAEKALEYLEPIFEEIFDKKDELPSELYETIHDLVYYDDALHPIMKNYLIEKPWNKTVKFIREATRLTELLLDNYKADKESGFPQVNEKLYDLVYSLFYQGYDEYVEKYNEMYTYFENRLEKLTGTQKENQQEDILNKNVFTNFPPRIPVETVRDRLKVVQLDYMSAVTFTGHNAEYIFTAPAILDSSVPTTGEFLDELARAQIVIPDDDSLDDQYATETMIKAIDDLEKAWKEAVRFARANINNPLRGAQERRARKLLETVLLIDIDDPEHKSARDALITILDGITYDIPDYDNNKYRTVSLYTKNIFDPNTLRTNKNMLSSTRKAIGR